MWRPAQSLSNSRSSPLLSPAKPWAVIPTQAVLAPQIMPQPAPQTMSQVPPKTHSAPQNKMVPEEFGAMNQTDCGCGWSTCLLCNGGKQPTLEVSCVSLGSWCGVSQCLRGNNLRTEAFPFDWNRVSLEGVIHFIETRFQGFLQYDGTKNFPYDSNHGGLTYCGKYHSFWHDDLTKSEVHEKYKRRIERFFNNPVRKLLFIRSVNESGEVSQVKQLLAVLQEAFSNHEVWLLIIVDHQSSSDAYVVHGTDNRLMIHTQDKRYLRTAPYYNDVKAYDQAILTAFGCALGRAVSPNFRQPGQVPIIMDLQRFAAQLEPFSSGDTRETTWEPKPISTHSITRNSIKNARHQQQQVQQLQLPGPNFNTFHHGSTCAQQHVQQVPAAIPDDARSQWNSLRRREVLRQVSAYNTLDQAHRNSLQKPFRPREPLETKNPITWCNETIKTEKEKREVSYQIPASNALDVSLSNFPSLFTAWSQLHPRDPVSRQVSAPMMQLENAVRDAKEWHNMIQNF